MFKANVQNGLPAILTTNQCLTNLSSCRCASLTAYAVLKTVAEVNPSRIMATAGNQDYDGASWFAGGEMSGTSAVQDIRNGTALSSAPMPLDVPLVWATEYIWHKPDDLCWYHGGNANGLHGPVQLDQTLPGLWMGRLHSDMVLQCLLDGVFAVHQCAHGQSARSGGCLFNQQVGIISRGP